VDWYYVGGAVLFLATLLAAAVMNPRVMHGLRDPNAWVWFWLVCAFYLSVKVVIWAVARIAALLQVIQTMPQANACSTRQPTPERRLSRPSLPPSISQRSTRLPERSGGPAYPVALHAAKIAVDSWRPPLRSARVISPAVATPPRPASISRRIRPAREALLGVNLSA